MSELPTFGEPEMVGWPVFTGAPLPPPPLVVTVDVAFEAALCVPSLFVAVTRKRMRKPTSPEVRTYVVPVAPEIVGQFEASGRPPSEPQRRHANV